MRHPGSLSAFRMPRRAAAQGIIARSGRPTQWPPAGQGRHIVSHSQQADDLAGGIDEWGFGDSHYLSVLMRQGQQFDLIAALAEDLADGTLDGEGDITISLHADIQSKFANAKGSS